LRYDLINKLYNYLLLIVKVILNYSFHAHYWRVMQQW